MRNHLVPLGEHTRAAAAWGLEHRALDGITARGIDEIAWWRGRQKCATLVCQFDAGAQRLLWIGRERTDWCRRTMRPRLVAVKEVAKMLSAHRDLLRNWFRARGRRAPGAVEGYSIEAHLTTKRAYGFRSSDLVELAS